jgi:hypothetical protein
VVEVDVMRSAAYGMLDFSGLTDQTMLEIFPPCILPGHKLLLLRFATRYFSAPPDLMHFFLAVRWHRKKAFHPEISKIDGRR